MKSKKLTLISLMIVMSVIVNIFERYLPSLSFIPGAKWGLANIIILVGTVFMGFKELFLIAFLRSVFSSFVIGTFMSIQFYLSISGAISSVYVMYFLSKTKIFSFIGVSVMGSFASNTAQLFVYSLFSGFVVMKYMPVLTIFSTLTGIVTGILSFLMAKKIVSIKKIY
jgi:heptaprenyl diphosphate synthase